MGRLIHVLMVRSWLELLNKWLGRSCWGSVVLRMEVSVDYQTKTWKEHMENFMNVENRMV